MKIEFKWIVIIALLLLLVMAGIYARHLRAELDKSKNESKTNSTLAEDLRQKISIQDGTITNQKRELNDLISWKKTYVPAEGKIELLVKENAELKAKIPAMLVENEKIKTQLTDVLDRISKATTPEEKEKLRKEAEELKKQLGESDKKYKEAMDKLQEIDVVTQSVGWTLRIGTDLLWNTDLYAGLDCKWFYFDRFSLCSGALFNLREFKESGIKLGAITYHIDGIVPEDWHWKNLELELALMYQFGGNNLKLLSGLRTNF